MSFWSILLRRATCVIWMCHMNVSYECFTPELCDVHSPSVGGDAHFRTSSKFVLWTDWFERVGRKLYWEPTDLNRLYTSRCEFDTSKAEEIRCTHKGGAGHRFTHSESCGAQVEGEHTSKAEETRRTHEGWHWSQAHSPWILWWLCRTSAELQRRIVTLPAGILWPLKDSTEGSDTCSKQSARHRYAWGQQHADPRCIVMTSETPARKQSARHRSAQRHTPWASTYLHPSQAQLSDLDWGTRFQSRGVCTHHKHGRWTSVMVDTCSFWWLFHSSNIRDVTVELILQKTHTMHALLMALTTL